MNESGSTLRFRSAADAYKPAMWPIINSVIATANIRTLLGIVLILCVSLGLSFWRFGRVAAQDAQEGEILSGRSMSKEIAQATFIVNNSDNAGPGSLRQAIIDANSNTPVADTINFDPTFFATPRTITLSSGELAITDSVTINGTGASLLTVSGNGASRVFSISGTPVVNINGLTVTGGNNSAINNATGGNLTVNSCVINANTGLFAGAIDNTTSTLTILNSTISGNTANGSGAAGGISNFAGTTTVTNSTISGNTANGGTGNGGGLRNGGSGTLNINNSTVTNNAASGGATGAAGVFRNTGTVTLRSTIVAANQNNATQPDVAATGNTGVTSNGFNLIGNRGTLAFSGTGDQSGTNPPLNPQFGLLTNNGGTTPTHALVGGSPALDKGDNTGSGQTTDQRGAGFARTIDLAGLVNAGDGTDVGSYEAQTDPGGTPTPTNTPTATPTPGAGFESDVAPRPDGDGSVITGDVVQMRRFATGLDTINPAGNEFQRADSAPRATFGDGVVNSGDVTQTRRYATGLDPQTTAAGPTQAVIAPPVEEFAEPEKMTTLTLSSLDMVEKGRAIVVGLTSLGGEAAVGFAIDYDSGVLERPFVMLGSEMPADAVLTVNTNDSGRIRILVDSAGELAKGGETTQMVVIIFDVTPQSSGFETAVTFGDESLNSASDGDGNPLHILTKGEPRVLGPSEHEEFWFTGRIVPPEELFFVNAVRLRQNVSLAPLP